MHVAGIEPARLQQGQDVEQPRDRVVGQMRIADMALHAVHGQPRGQRAATADLHHLAEPERIDRKRVLQGKSVSVRVDLGGRPTIKKKTKLQTYNDQYKIPTYN